MYRFLHSSARALTEAVLNTFLFLQIINPANFLTDWLTVWPVTERTPFSLESFMLNWRHLYRVNFNRSEEQLAIQLLTKIQAYKTDNITLHYNE